MIGALGPPQAFLLSRTRAMNITSAYSYCMLKAVGCRSRHPTTPSSKIDLLGDIQCIIDLDTEIPDCALNLGMSK